MVLDMAIQEPIQPYISVLNCRWWDDYVLYCCHLQHNLQQSQLGDPAAESAACTIIIDQEHHYYMQQIESYMHSLRIKKL